MSDDDTEAALASGGAADDETTVVPGPTQVAAALAWSTEEPHTDDLADGDDDEPEPKLGRRDRKLLGWLRPDDDVWTDEDDAAYTRGTVKIFVGLMAVAVIAAAWMVGVWLTHRGDHSAPSASPTTTTSPLPPLSTTDAAFLRSLQSEGISIDGTQGSIDGLITMAQHVCTGVGQGLSKPDIANKIHDANPKAMTQGDAKDFVDSAVESYCPPTTPAPPT